MTSTDTLRHQMVMAELARLGITHASEVPPVIAASIIVDEVTPLGVIIVVGDTTTVDVWDLTPHGSELQPGETLRDHDPQVHTVGVDSLDRVASRAVVDLAAVSVAQVGRAVIRAMGAAAAAHLARLDALVAG